MSKGRTWDVEEIAERRKIGRFRAAVSTAAQSVMVVGLAVALSPVTVHAISAATSEYSVVSVRSQSVPPEVRARRSHEANLIPTYSAVCQPAVSGRGPAFFRETDPKEIDDVDLPLL